MPIYQHLSRSKNTVVVGKIIDSMNQSPILNVTVSARMPGYQCASKQIQAGEDGIFQIEFPHLRNNYPYSVELRLVSSDGSYAEIKKDVNVGGVIRSPYIYVEIPMSSNSDQRATSEILSY